MSFVEGLDLAKEIESVRVDDESLGAIRQSRLSRKAIRRTHRLRLSSPKRSLTVFQTMTRSHHQQN